jgi:hypothetical protein
MLALAHVVDLFSHKLTSLSRRCFTLLFVFTRSLYGFFFWPKPFSHYNRFLSDTSAECLHHGLNPHRISDRFSFSFTPMTDKQFPVLNPPLIPNHSKRLAQFLPS